MSDSDNDNPQIDLGGFPSAADVEAGIPVSPVTHGQSGAISTTPSGPAYHAPISVNSGEAPVVHGGELPPNIEMHGPQTVILMKDPKATGVSDSHASGGDEIDEPTTPEAGESSPSAEEKRRDIEASFSDGPPI